MKIYRTTLGLFLSIFAVTHQAWAIAGGVDPRYVNVKVYEVRLSQNANCTGGISVFRNASPSYQDWVNSPTLGSGAIPNGTYNCVMVKMSDYIHYTPSTTDGSWTHGVCTVGTDNVLDVAHDEIAIDPDGNSQSLGVEGTESIVWLYVRTGATGTGQNTWVPTGGIALTSPLVVNGDGTHTMIFDFSNQVSEVFNNGAWQCGCEAPTMGFR